MRSKINNLKTKIKDKKEGLKQANKESKENIRSFFQACGIRTINY